MIVQCLHDLEIPSRPSSGRTMTVFSAHQPPRYSTSGKAN
jgi:hypothetical protein